MSGKADVDHLTKAIIEAVINVHKVLGPGFMEGAYRNALEIELRDRGYKVEREKEIHLYYKTEPIGLHRLDLVVEDAVVLELKVAKALNKNHYAQIRAYLKASGINTGLLINFFGSKADYRRVNKSDPQ
jgi:GxxExxY protein